jgi:hypothetical protein
MRQLISNTAVGYVCNARSEDLCLHHGTEYWPSREGVGPLFVAWKEASKVISTL